MAQSFFPVAPVKITNSATNYNFTPINVTPFGVPVGASGALFYVYNGGTGASRDWEVSYLGGGHTAGGPHSIGGLSHTWAFVGLDANRFEFYNVALSNRVQLWLLAYTMAPGVVSLATTPDISPPAYLAWTLVDLSAHIPTSATGVILNNYNYYAPRSFGQRMVGSTDNRTASPGGTHTTDTFIIGCTNRQIELYRGSVGVRHRLLAYITDGCVFYQNAVLATPDGIGWNPPGVKPIDLSIAFFEELGVAGNYGCNRSLGYSLASILHNNGFTMGSEWLARKSDAGTNLYMTSYAAALFAPTVQTDPATEIT